jgi:histone deacetylase 4/5
MMSCLRCSPCHILDVATSYNTIFMNEYSVEAAMYAAGLTIEATRAVMESSSSNRSTAAKSSAASAVCVVRPPGHHSECGRAMGFGIFNSVAAAAADALAGGGAASFAAGAAAGASGGAAPRAPAERVLIVDWDIHHGNGTQEIFADDKRVLYFSAHSLYAFPAYSSGDLDVSLQSPGYTGGAGAKGYSVNCAWGAGANSFAEGYGDCEYLRMMDELLMPIARSFDPSLVIVSAGFDSAAGDEMEFLVTPSGYARMLRRLKRLAGGRVVVVLEGGYNIPAVSRGLHACVAELLAVCGVVEGEEEAAQVQEQALADIRLAVEAQKPYWPGLV